MRSVVLSLVLVALARGACVPARWPADAATLPLLEGSPINCLLIDATAFTPAFRARAQRKVLAVAQNEASAVAAMKAGADGLVLEGAFDDAQRARLKKLDPQLIEFRPRIALDFGAAVIATTQAVWPGINTHDEEGKAETGPTGAPWIDTNAGFLRFARASLSSPGAELWLANRPPPRTAVSAERYLQVIADAAMLGARWVVALDDDFFARLQRAEPKVTSGWKRIQQLLAFYEAHPEWRSLRAYGQLAVVQDGASGGLLSGGILDMISVKHTPLVPVPKQQLAQHDFTGVKMAVNVDTGALTPAQKEKLQQFTRAGGTLLSGPPGWRMPPPSATQITLAKEEIAKLDEIWREVNALMGRRNLGARLFNVSSMLSSLTATAGGSRVVLHLVNYSDYPVDSIAVHLLGKFRRATLLTPEAPAPQTLHLYDNEDGSGVDIDTIRTVGVLTLDR